MTEIKERAEPKSSIRAVAYLAVAVCLAINYSYSIAAGEARPVADLIVGSWKFDDNSVLHIKECARSQGLCGFIYGIDPTIPDILNPLPIHRTRLLCGLQLATLDKQINGQWRTGKFYDPTDGTVKKLEIVTKDKNLTLITTRNSDSRAETFDLKPIQNANLKCTKED